MTGIVIWKSLSMITLVSVFEQKPKFPHELLKFLPRGLDIHQLPSCNYAEPFPVVSADNTNRRQVSNIKSESIYVPFNQPTDRGFQWLTVILLWLSCDLLPTLLSWLTMLVFLLYNNL